MTGRAQEYARLLVAESARVADLDSRIAQIRQHLTTAHRAGTLDRVTWLACMVASGLDELGAQQAARQHRGGAA